MPRNALGRGLGALIRENEPPKAAAPPPAAATGAASSSAGTNPDMTASGPGRTTIPAGADTVAIDLIDPNPFQPRTKLCEEAMEEGRVKVGEHARGWGADGETRGRGADGAGVVFAAEAGKPGGEGADGPSDREDDDAGVAGQRRGDHQAG